MPEEFEAESTDLQVEPETETVEAESSEVQSETEPKTPRHIPFERFQEVYDDLKSERQGRLQLQQQVMQMQQALLEATRPQKQPVQAPKIDPEIDELVTPSISTRLSPLEQRLARQEEINARLYAQQQAASAMDYVKESVQDFDELAPDIQAYLASIPQGRANKITSDPDLVIQTAEMVRAMKQAGKAVGNQTARQDLKQRGKSDVGAASPGIPNSKIQDWSALSDEEYAAQEARLERQRRRG